MNEESLRASQTDRNLLTPPTRQECLRSPALGGSPHPQSCRDSSRPQSSVPPTRRRPSSLRSGSAPPSAEARPAVLAQPAARAEFWDRHGNAASLACRPLRPPAGSCGRPWPPGCASGQPSPQLCPEPAVRAYWRPRLRPSPAAVQRLGERRRRWAGKSLP